MGGGRAVLLCWGKEREFLSLRGGIPYLLKGRKEKHESIYLHSKKRGSLRRGIFQIGLFKRVKEKRGRKNPSSVHGTCSRKERSDGPERIVFSSGKGKGEKRKEGLFPLHIKKGTVVSKKTTFRGRGEGG